MPLPAPPAGPSRDVATTPTRRPAADATTGIAAGIPPIMLQTPPHAPFITSPSPFHDGRASVLGNDHPRLQRNLRQYHTLTMADQVEESSQLQAAESDQPMSDAGPGAGDENDSLLESMDHDPDDTRQLIGLRDISSLATWTLSSAKPGCALSQLRHPSPSHFWQSDGPQPHTLTLHFFKLVAIVKMRVYLDFKLDESYTPTKMKFYAGMSEGGLVEFATWEVQEQTDPVTQQTFGGVEDVQGWIDISLQGVGGREPDYDGIDVYPNHIGQAHDFLSTAGFDNYPYNMKDVSGIFGDHAPVDAISAATGGDVLKCMVVQVRICENHQSGKDTHVRGFQVFARDENAGKGSRKIVKKGAGHGKAPESFGGGNEVEEEQMFGLAEAPWMGEPEIR